MSRTPLLLGLVLLPALSGLAAQTLDADALPRQGTMQIGSGSSDALDLTISIPDEHPAPDCVGHLHRGAPDATVTLSDTSPMRLWVRSATDATLTVIGPDGTQQCVDDEDGVQPALLYEQPLPGRYAVWIGAFGEAMDASPTATLYAGPPPPPARPGNAAAAPLLAFSGDDDVDLDLMAGGLHPAESLGMPEYCLGFFNAEPSARVSGSAPYSVMATSDADLTLAVRTRGGGWLCNDDASPFGYTDPAIEVQGEGEQAVWVGTFRGYARGEAPEATLVVTSETITAVEPPMPVGPREYFHEAEYVTLDLDARGEELILAAGDDELEVAQLELGEGVGNPLSGTSCSGNLPRERTFTLTIEGDGPVTLLASAEDDLVMAVRDAQGNWFCSDDASGRNPAVEVEGGEVAIWIGTFSSMGGANATFTATRGEIADVLPEPEFSEFDEGMFEGPISYSDGSYSGDELDGQAQATLALSGGMAESLVFAGGEMFNPVEGSACTGYLSADPAARLESSAETLAFMATASFEEDLTLVVRAPDGRWFCSDDHEGTAPGLEVSGAGDGTYTIWVGTFQSLDTPVEAALSVMEGSLPSAE